MKNFEEKKKGTSFIEKMFSGRGFYITLASITLVVGIITYFGIKASFNATNPDDITPPDLSVDDPINSGGPVSDNNPVLPDLKDPSTTVPDDNKPTDTPQIPTLTYCLPVGGVITKDFSGDALVFSSTMGDYRVHTGIDITAEDGAEVLAVADGEITRVYSDDMKGVCVEVSHSDGHTSVYCNLRTVLADGTVEGAAVKGGEVLGYVGTTSLLEIGDPAHLHFEMLKDGEHISPTTVLPSFEK